ncbi:M12 family metallo-peptidase [Pseudomonas capeferrum]|uniref:zinc-dependent metalloprotease family protein n=1 Tax=Pseudomonas capeferrum TaxID=1495066 RepID=UPI0004D7C004|nr:M12 family metallo-peptidase [Pseudomonas capeferrum]KEY85108.1 hypothetical protein PC358_25260 [Pseudomonas capeferrum]MCH7300128.1 M12 family metallo-peptidase [Pseudomonas capeferrum]
MKKAIWKTCLVASALFVVWGCSASKPTFNAPISAAPQLFTLEPTQDRKTLQSTATGALATLLADTANAEITLVKADTALVSKETKVLAVSLPDGKKAQFNLRDFTTITPGIDGWVGYKPSAWKQAHPTAASEIDNDPFYYLSLVREGDKLVGDVVVEGKRYRLTSISPGLHALIQVDETKLPPEAEPLVDSKASARDNTAGRVAQSAHSTIRVLFLTTNQRRARNPNYKAELAQALNNANQYMKNSDVQITYQLAGYYDGDYDEAGRTHTQQLGDIRTAKPYSDRVLSERERLGADLVVQYSTVSSVCGVAWRPAFKANAHSLVSCLGSLAHEMGHNLGATHNWEEGDSAGAPPYMYGYRYTGTPRFRTQMSYDCSGGSCPRIAYHSNPRLTYQGIPLGTAANHDVARRFNERREVVENFYPPANAVRVTGYLDRERLWGKLESQGLVGTH